MSLRAILWAFDQEVFPASNKFVLVAMGNFCGDTALSHPNIASICKLTSLHEETVTKALASLVEQGKLEDTGMTTGATGRIKVYRFPDSCAEIPRQNGVLKRRIKPGQSSGNTRVIPGQSPVLAADHIDGTGTATPTKNKSAPPAQIPTSLDTQEFRTAWDEWLNDRKARRKPVTEVAKKLQLAKLEKMGEQAAVWSIAQSIENGWAGLFEPRGDRGRAAKPSAPAAPDNGEW